MTSLCCAAPAKQPTTLSRTSSTIPKTRTSSVGTKSTPSLQSSAKAPPVLLSQATADQAGGGVPSGPLPETSFTPNAVQLFKVANFIENIESAFFAQVLQSLGKDQTFNAPTRDGRSIANVTSQIAAQELVHIATVGGLLGAVGEPSVPPCATVVGVSDTNDFLAKSNVITSASIGVIISLISTLATSDAPLVRPLASILSTESQQDTFFRMTGNNTPSAAPFNTGLSTTFAYNIALNLVDPRSCPQLMPLPILPSLNLTSPIMTATSPATPPTSITFNATGAPQGRNLYIGWVNQVNPVVYTNVTVKGGVGSADVPKGLTGMTFAALTAQTMETTVDGLSNATLAGPAPVLLS
ncbi:sexual development protein [Rutstroemia sp. NJR-2017a BVV2]|nr:sexual development protein [Rutstroemia sp. NJR-2017a BVV2]PQE09400.1 sexual development protein [Rutstroemia sp. NJR-2017a BVV2]